MIRGTSGTVSLDVPRMESEPETERDQICADSGHPTELVHRHLADAIEAQLIGL